MEKLHDWLPRVKKGKEVMLEQIGLYSWKVDTYLKYISEKYIYEAIQKSRSR